MKILLVPDKFKGTLTSVEIGNLATKVAQKYDLDIKVIPMADGGDGSVDILENKITLSKITIHTYDALMRRILASYFIDQSTKTAYIELAKTAGIALIAPLDRDIMQATTYGTGLMIADAMERDVEQIFLFIGGSATNEAALGCAEALGFKLLNKDFDPVEGNGKNLIKLHQIRFTKKTLPKITIVSDVDNIMHGHTGAAYVYGAQKGATPEQIEYLDKGLQNVGRLFDQTKPGTTQIKGGGAAGAFGAGAIALFNADVCNGFDFLAQLFDLEKEIKEADLIITGEGSLDSQSLQGKIVGKLIDLADKYGKDIEIVCGKTDDNEEVFSRIPVGKVHTILSRAKNVEDGMRNAGRYLEEIIEEIFMKINFNKLLT